MRVLEFVPGVPVLLLLLQAPSVAAAPPRVLPAAQSAAPVVPDAVGLSAPRLARLDGFVERLVSEGEIAGAVVLVARRGRVAHEGAYGQLDREAGVPMSSDAIFRICSMSKAITSVAVMMLYEEGHFLLDDPVSRFLPEFEAMQVIVPAPAGATSDHGLVPAARPITIRHLLTHTSGISYRFFGLPIIGDLYAGAGISDGLSETDVDLAENVRRIAAQPLLHDPGERFSYGLNTDVLGRLVEVVSGRSLGAFLETRIFAPLHMPDTGFRVPAAKRGRLAAIYRTDHGGLERLPEGPVTEGYVVFSPSYPYAEGMRYESGGGGLVSTASDYARFAQMLLNGGELDGERLLSRKTVELMTSDHIGGVAEPPGHGFGLGLSIAHDPGRSGAVLTEGTLGWTGFYTTAFWIDPVEDLVGIVMTQTYPYDSGQVLERLRAMVYQAVAD